MGAAYKGNQAGDDRVVAVAMSGGVDSSVAACLLKEQGFRVIGLTMRLFCYERDDPSAKSCCNLKAIADAREVCAGLGAPHYVIDCEGIFQKEVIERFVESYLSGRTPNPCVDCNSRVKFSFLLRKAQSLGAQFLATGHYVRLIPPGDSPEGSPKLARALDKGKDQSYFLWGISREHLSRFIFPLGEYRKKEVRHLAEKFGLLVSGKRESQEVCFVDSGGLEEFIRGYKKSGSPEDSPHPNLEPGPLVDKGGRRLGMHRGSAFYTIGQRRGLGLALGKPAYVTAIDPVTNTVVVGNDGDLMADRIEASNVNYLVSPPEEPFRAEIKVRYKNKPVGAWVFPEPEEQRITVKMDKPQRAVTPGQSVVFYAHDILLGGGKIESAGSG
ncbi:MAG TPA: tRNA 2-thiouridine(34) synthase MnmA [archaeon]|nr:tRNA 2-thiouridine(34) synthase MnmA [archaeon]